MSSAALREATATSADSRWLSWARRAALLRIAPVYPLSVLAMWLLLHYGISDSLRSEIIFNNSTNVANLDSHRYYPLITSAFFIDGNDIFILLMALGVSLAVAEWAWGWRRVAVVMLAGHVGGSLLVYLGLKAMLATDLIDGDVATNSDVGVSFVLAAVVATTVFLLPRWRWLGIAAVVLAVGVPLAIVPSVMDVGHLLAAAIGVVAGWLLTRKRKRALNVYRPQ